MNAFAAALAALERRVASVERLLGQPGRRVPLGGLVLVPSPVVLPAPGYVPAGSTVLRSDYAALFDAVGVTFGAGDGVSTFVASPAYAPPSGWVAYVRAT